MNEKSLSAFWREHLSGSRWWRCLNPDGFELTPYKDGYALSATAYTHICRRCLAQQDQVVGEIVICSRCHLASVGIYRRVVVIIGSDFLHTGPHGLIARIGALRLADLHPAILPTETTEIELARWADFTNGNEATWWSEPA